MTNNYFRINPDAKYFIVGEYPNDSDLERQEPFSGARGDELRRMLVDAGIRLEECSFGYVLGAKPPSYEDISFFVEFRKGYIKKRGMQMFRGRGILPIVEQNVRQLEQVLKAANPQVIIACGELALWALTGKAKIGSWRGSILPAANFLREDGHPAKVICTLDPGYILKVWEDRFVMVQDLRRAARESSSPRVNLPAYRFIVQPSFNETVSKLNWILERLEEGPFKLAVDIETRQKQIACIGFAWSRLEAICIPILRGDGSLHYWPTLEEEYEVVHLMVKILTHRNLIGGGQNFNYDDQYIAFWGALSRVHHDTMLTHHVNFPGISKGLDFLASLWCEFYQYWKSESKEWSAKMDETILWTYNCKDCVVTYELMEVLDNVTKSFGLTEQEQFQQELRLAVRATMLRGFKVDMARREEYTKELTPVIEAKSAAINAIAGHELNVRSPHQMKKFFYEDLHIVPIYHRKSKKPTLDDAALVKIAKKEPLLRRLISDIQDLRSLMLFKKLFLEAKPINNRMYTSINSGGAETFRFSSSGDPFGSGMNMQNISSGSSGDVMRFVHDIPEHQATVAQISAGLQVPISKVWDMIDKEIKGGTIAVSGTGSSAVVTFKFYLPNVRKIFIPDEGYTISDWDLNRADLQVVVWESGELGLKQMLRENVDMHTENAKVLGITRDQAKIFVHLTNYRGKPATAADATGLTRHQAEVGQRRWFEAWPGIRQWHERTWDELNKTHSVRNAFGYRRFYFNRIDDSTLREALGWKPQSTVAIVINTGFLRLHKELPEVQVLMQVHDSIVPQFPTAKKEILVPQIEQKLLVTVPYEDPLVIPVSCKLSEKSWGDCKPYNFKSLGGNV